MQSHQQSNILEDKQIEIAKKLE